MLPITLQYYQNTSFCLWDSTRLLLHVETKSRTPHSQKSGLHAIFDEEDRELVHSASQISALWSQCLVIQFGRWQLYRYCQRMSLTFVQTLLQDHFCNMWSPNIFLQNFFTFINSWVLKVSILAPSGSPIFQYSTKEIVVSQQKPFALQAAPDLEAYSIIPRRHPRMILIDSELPCNVHMSRRQKTSLRKEMGTICGPVQG